ncbi:MAG: hypothetical protein ACOCX4_01545 [Planctomycetota bacterium]
MEEKKKLIITAAIVGFVCLLLVGALAYQVHVLGEAPLAHEESLLAEIDRLETQKAGLEQRVNVELPARRQELESLKGLATLAGQLLPDEIRPEDLLRFVREKAEQALIGIHKSEIVQPRQRPGFGQTATDPWEERVLKLELLGDYDSLGLFINYLETFEMAGPDGKPVRRFFAVKDLQIEAEDDGLVEDGEHEITLEVSTYRYKAAPAAAGF